MSANRQANEKKKSDPRKEKNRGTQNELEIMAQIVAELSYLRDNVLRRMEPMLARKGIKPEGAPKEGASTSEKKKQDEK
jgi:hypothetical protein